MDMGNSAVVRLLYRIRGLPEGGLSLEGMLKWGFILLADEPSREIVFGLHHPQRVAEDNSKEGFRITCAEIFFTEPQSCFRM